MTGWFCLNRFIYAKISDSLTGSRRRAFIISIFHVIYSILVCSKQNQMQSRCRNLSNVRGSCHRQMFHSKHVSFAEKFESMGNQWEWETRSHVRNRLFANFSNNKKKTSINKPLYCTKRKRRSVCITFKQQQQQNPFLSSPVIWFNFSDFLL